MTADHNDDAVDMPPRMLLYGFYVLLFAAFVTVLVVVGIYT